MALFRKDPFGRAWVLVSPERGLQSSDFGSVEAPVAASPLSPGSDAQPGEELAALRGDGGQEWLVRALRHPAGLVERAPGTVTVGSDLLRQEPAFGYHELIVEHPDARERLQTMSVQHLGDVWRFYRDRFVLAVGRPGVRHAQISRNCGRAAGAQYDHPYGQLIAVAVTDRWVEEEMLVAREHFAGYHECVFCSVTDAELSLRERLVTENESFVAFTPFAAKTPFETWVVPKRHASSFAEASDGEIDDLARILQLTVGGLVAALDGPPYNLTLHSHTRAGGESYHWHVEILPRLTSQAGFDWGTGFFVNPTLPEDSARFLREAIAVQTVRW